MMQTKDTDTDTDTCKVLQSFSKYNPIFYLQYDHHEN